MCPATQNYRTTGKIAARRFKHIPYASKCGQQLYTSAGILGRAVTIVCIYACMYVYVSVYVYVNVNVYVHVYMYMNMCKCTRMFVCMYVCMYV